MLRFYRRIFLFLFLFSALGLVNANAQDKITFVSSDKLIITADLYLINDTLPYMVLCHDINSSRGEYKELAHKFNKLGYNCLAIDMRSGGTKNGVENETASLAQAKHITAKFLDSRTDITSAIVYAYNLSHKKVVLVGSGCSASLALYIGSNNPELVASVLAFSPSDCFNGTLDTKNVFSKCPIPVLVASSRSEAVATKNFVATIPQSKLTLFSPSTDGAHGTAALLTATPDHHDYWISILLYIRQVQT